MLNLAGPGGVEVEGGGISTSWVRKGRRWSATALCPPSGRQGKGSSGSVPEAGGESKRK